MERLTHLFQLFPVSLNFVIICLVWQMLVHVKNRSNVNIACADPNTDGKPRIPILRPVSAPSTKREALRAFRKAGETGHLKTNGDSRSVMRRPHTTYGQRRTPTPDSSINSGQGVLFVPLTSRESLTNGSFWSADDFWSAAKIRKLLWYSTLRTSLFRMYINEETGHKTIPVLTTVQSW